MQITSFSVSLPESTSQLIFMTVQCSSRSCSPSSAKVSIRPNGLEDNRELCSSSRFALVWPGWNMCFQPALTVETHPDCDQHFLLLSLFYAHTHTSHCVVPVLSQRVLFVRSQGLAIEELFEYIMKLC